MKSFKQYLEENLGSGSKISLSPSSSMGNFRSTPSPPPEGEGEGEEGPVKLVPTTDPTQWVDPDGNHYWDSDGDGVPDMIWNGDAWVVIPPGLEFEDGEEPDEDEDEDEEPDEGEDEDEDEDEDEEPDEEDDDLVEIPWELWQQLQLLQPAFNPGLYFKPPGGEGGGDGGGGGGNINWYKETPWKPGYPHPSDGSPSPSTPGNWIPLPYGNWWNTDERRPRGRQEYDELEWYYDPSNIGGGGSMP